MISSDADSRPSTACVLKHPFFWSPEKQLLFFQVLDHFYSTPRVGSASLMLSFVVSFLLVFLLPERTSVTAQRRSQRRVPSWSGWRRQEEQQSELTGGCTSLSPYRQVQWHPEVFITPPALLVTTRKLLCVFVGGVWGDQHYKACNSKVRENIYILYSFPLFLLQRCKSFEEYLYQV